VNFEFLSAVEIAQQVAHRRVSAREIAERCLHRLHECEPSIHAWAHLDADRFLQSARALDARIAADGDAAQALAGVPIGIKDVFNTSDMPTEMGSSIWKGFTPGNDARVVHALRRADALFPGKTVSAEFSVHATPPTRNPHDLNRTPGTSSSGSAAAVAAGVVPLALGTQTAGSIIRPASYCGVYGYKPSFGMLPRTGVLKTTDSLDTVGMFSASFADLALLLRHTAVRGHNYPFVDAAARDPNRRHRNGVPWRVGLLVEPPTWSHAEPYARDALVVFADALAGAGVEVEKIKLPERFFLAHEIHATIYDKAVAYYFEEEFEQHSAQMSPLLREMMERGRAIGIDAYKAALLAQHQLATEFDTLISACDAWLTLSTGGVAVDHDGMDRPDTCLIWTLCGAPTVSVPAFTYEALPFGAQFIGRKYDDSRLLDLLDLLRRSDVIRDAPPRLVGRNRP
jgi:Asp-tRNA(Asn)/Glu-tRNA(Gln) amidotransferase A subunit family amidase